MSTYESPPWGRTTKTIVVVVALLLIALVAWRFSGLIQQLVMAAVLAYLLNPLITFVNRNTGLKRGTLVVLTYFAFIILVIGAFTAVGVGAYAQVNNLLNQMPRLIDNAVNLLRDWAPAANATFELGPFEFSPSTLDWNAIRSQVLGMVEPILSRGGQYAGQIAGATVRIVGNFLFIWVVSIYLALEIPGVRDYVAAAAQRPGYRKDAERLMAEFSRVWSAYLRGQIMLGLIIGVTVGLSLRILGVQNALALGILSGLLEFVPVVGPIIGTGAAVIVAFFQPQNYLGLTAIEYALAVFLVMFVIQQLENNLLVPNIVGDALDLHPLVVIVGVFMGASLAGILGAILAAPLLASFKLLGNYAWRKLFDLPPFEEEASEPPSSSPFQQRLRNLWARLRRRVEASQEETAGPDAP